MCIYLYLCSRSVFVWSDFFKERGRRSSYHQESDLMTSSFCWRKKKREIFLSFFRNRQQQWEGKEEEEGDIPHVSLSLQEGRREPNIHTLCLSLSVVFFRSISFDTSRKQRLLLTWERRRRRPWGSCCCCWCCCEEDEKEEESSRFLFSFYSSKWCWCDMYLLVLLLCLLLQWSF